MCPHSHSNQVLLVLVSLLPGLQSLTEISDKCVDSQLYKSKKSKNLDQSRDQSDSFAARSEKQSGINKRSDVYSSVLTAQSSLGSEENKY